MRAQLHFDRVAAGGITLPFLLAAPFFGAIAAALLAIAGGDVLLSRWHPALIGALHVYTIGFLLLTIAGALLQIGPVVTARTALASERAAGLLRFALGTGALCIGCGLFHAWRALLVPGVLLLALALPVWLALAVRGLGISRASRDLLYALAGLCIGIAFGLRLAAGHAFVQLDIPRQYTDLHAGWMLLGGIAPLIMAVGVIVIPMFQHTVALTRAQWLPALGVAGMSLETLSGSYHIGAAIAALALAGFAIIVLVAHARRRNSTSDPTVHLFSIAMCCALAGLAAWSAAVFLPAWRVQLQWSGGVLLITGFAGTCVHGMTLKIVPFLVRLRLQRALWDSGRPAISLPGFQQLLPRERARSLPWLNVAAIALLVLAGVTQSTLVLLAGAVALFLAQFMLGMLLMRAVIDGLRYAIDTDGLPTVFNEESTT